MVTRRWGPLFLLGAVGFALAASVLSAPVGALDALGYAFSHRWDARPPRGKLNTPAGIAMGPDGNIWLADTENHGVQASSATGACQRQWRTHGMVSGQLAAPRGVAIARVGMACFADSEQLGLYQGCPHRPAAVGERLG